MIRRSISTNKRAFNPVIYEAIKASTSVSEVNGIKMHLITPRDPLYSVRDERFLPFPDPWWAFCWPGGKYLSKFIMAGSYPVSFKNKSVCDIGSGCGISSIASVMMGASRVVANDIDPYAGAALEMNLSLNNIPTDKVDILIENKIPTNREEVALAKLFFSQFDIIICGDMLYDTMLSASLLLALDEHPCVLLGDPGRHGCPRDILDSDDKALGERLLASYPHMEDGFSSVKVFRLNAPSGC